MNPRGAKESLASAQQHPEIPDAISTRATAKLERPSGGILVSGSQAFGLQGWQGLLVVVNVDPPVGLE